MSDQERREQIVAVAEKLFIENGYAGTSTESIAACCKISKQTLYRIFPGKLEIFAGVVRTHRLRMIDLDESYDDLPLGEALAKIFMIDLDEDAYKVRAAFLRTANIESLQHPQLREIMKRQGGEKSRSELTAWLERQTKKRDLCINDVYNTAHMLMDTFTGSVIFDAIGGFGWDTMEERVAHFRQCIDIVLNGMLARHQGDAIEPAV